MKLNTNAINNERLVIDKERNNMNEKEKNAFNMATDIVLEQHLLDNKHPLLEQYSLPKGKTAQEYYDLLVEKM